MDNRVIELKKCFEGKMARKIFGKKIPSLIKDQSLIEERRNQIFESARKLFSEKGYHKTGLREICKASEISVGNLYNYINTKEDILSIIHRKTYEIVLQAISQGAKNIRDPKKKLKQMIEIELRTMDKYQDLVLILYQESHMLSKDLLLSVLKNEETHLKRFQEAIEHGISVGAFRPVNSLILAHIIKMMIDSWVLKRWALRKVGIKEMTRDIWELLERGFLNPEPSSRIVPIEEVGKMSLAVKRRKQRLNETGITNAGIERHDDGGAGRRH